MEKIELILRYILQGNGYGEKIDICDFTLQEQIKLESQISSTRCVSAGRKSSEEFKRKPSNSKIQKQASLRKIKITPKGMRPTISEPLLKGNKIRQVNSSSGPKSAESSKSGSKTTVSKASNTEISNISGNHSSKVSEGQIPSKSDLINDVENHEKINHNIDQHPPRSKDNLSSQKYSDMNKTVGKTVEESEKVKANSVTASEATKQQSSTSQKKASRSCKSNKSNTAKTDDSKYRQNPELLPPSTHGRSIMAENIILNVDEIDPEYVPVVNRTVYYVVAGIFVNTKNEILLIEEAAPTRRGLWCVPAGNVTQGEDLVDAFSRIVKEETGLQVEAVTLLQVEYSSAEWFRFVMTGNIIGGKLKGQNYPDSYSLQAEWFSDFSKLKLRGGDEIISIIECGRMYSKKKGTQEWHKDLVPTKLPQEKLYFRIVFCLTKTPNNIIRVLILREPKYHLPVCELHPDRNFEVVLSRFLEKLFGPNVPARKIHGVLAVEHKGIAEPTPLNGFCLTLLVSCKTRYEYTNREKNYIWLEVPHELGEEILIRMKENMCVQFRSVGVH